MKNQRRELFEQKLIEKALKDESFRQQMIENPIATIEAETGMKIPETMKIIVLEEDPQTVFLVLPQVYSKVTEMELSETELEGVAGGSIASGCFENRKYVEIGTKWPQC